MYSVSLREAAQILDVPMDEIRRKIKKGELRATQIVTPGGLGMGVALPGDPPRWRGAVSRQLQPERTCCGTNAGSQ